MIAIWELAIELQGIRWAAKYWIRLGFGVELPQRPVMASSAINPRGREMSAHTWRWIWGMVYIVAVAVIWIAASFVVQSVVGSGVTPFLITYICNSLFVIYIPIVESRRYLQRALEGQGWWGKNVYRRLVHEPEKAAELPPQGGGSVEGENRLENGGAAPSGSGGNLHQFTRKEISRNDHELHDDEEGQESSNVDENGSIGNAEDLADKPWSRKRTALVGLTICPFWFLAQFTFNLSLKYTTVTVSSSERPLVCGWLLE